MAAGRSIDPVAQFMQEHDHALQQLAALNRAIRALEEHGCSPAVLRRVDTALEFIHEEVSVHNSREEEALFPVLERYVEGPTDVMRREHRVLQRRYAKLRKAADRLRTRPNSRPALRELADSASAVVQLLVNHIHKENQILFPLVRKFLTRDALREVARRMV
jgi:hemerythrin-like domain-containing protein